MTDDPEEGLKDRPTAYVLYNNRQEAHTTPSFAFTLTPVTGKRPESYGDSDKERVRQEDINNK